MPRRNSLSLRDRAVALSIGAGAHEAFLVTMGGIWSLGPLAEATPLGGYINHCSNCLPIRCTGRTIGVKSRPISQARRWGPLSLILCCAGPPRLCLSEMATVAMIVWVHHRDFPALPYAFERTPGSRPRGRAPASAILCAPSAR